MNNLAKTNNDIEFSNDLLLDEEFDSVSEEEFPHFVDTAPDNFSFAY